MLTPPILDDEGVVAHAKPGALIIDMSTIRPAVARMVAQEATSRGFRVLDAPVSGEQAAIEGTLSIMVGGDTADFEGAQSLLEAVGSTIVHSSVRIPAEETSSVARFSGRAEPKGQPVYYLQTFG